MGKLSRFHSPLSEVDQAGASRELLAIYQVSTLFWKLWTFSPARNDTLCPSKTPLQFEKVESWLMYKGHGVQPKVCFRSWPFPQTWTGLTINAKRVCECAGRGRGLCLLKKAVLKMGWKQYCFSLYHKKDILLIRSKVYFLRMMDMGVIKFCFVCVCYP